LDYEQGSQPSGVVKTKDRQQGVRGSVKALAMNPVRGKKVLIKPNFNTADRYRGSTRQRNPLRSLVEELWPWSQVDQFGRTKLSPHSEVMEQKRDFYHFGKNGMFKSSIFDGLPAKDWVEFQTCEEPLAQWISCGQAYPGDRMFDLYLLSEDASIWGVFTMSLKTPCRGCSYGPSWL